MAGKAFRRGRLVSLFVFLGAAISAPASDRPSVVVITIDCLRADHLPCYGYKEMSTPTLDKFASEAVLFENCTAQAPWTTPSMAAMNTSLYATSCSVYDNIHRLSEDYTTMPEVFRDQGYMTGAFIAHSVLASPRMGILQGFSSFNGGVTIENKVNFRVLMPALFEFLGNYRHMPLYLWLHFMEVHRPTTIENPYLRDHHRYDAEIRLVDDHLGRLFAELRTMGVYDNSYIVFTADHGEHLGGPPHFLAGHQNSVYEELAHIPLMIRGPGLPGGKRIKAIVELVDLMPTLLDLGGIEPQSVMQGHSLVPLIRGEVNKVRDFAVCERPYMHEPPSLPYSLHTFSIREPRWKMIIQVPCAQKRTGREPLNWNITDEGASLRLFDLVNDPLEAKDVSEDPRTKSVYDMLLKKFLAYKEHQAQMFEIGPGVQFADMDPDVRSRLEGLGYTLP